MAGLVPGIHVLVSAQGKTWMAGTSPAMTMRKNVSIDTVVPYEIGLRLWATVTKDI
jgi:hypothetical protein